MTTPKFKIGQKLFYKGHLHCTIMDIIQENFVFTYEINMTLNNRNKIVDEWDLFENKEKARFKNEPKIKQPKNPFGFTDEALEIYKDKKMLHNLIIEFRELKQMIEKLNSLVTYMSSENKIDKSIEKFQEPIVKKTLQEIIDKLKVGQKKTFINSHPFSSIKKCVEKCEYEGKEFHIIDISKGLSKKVIQVYRFL